MLSAAAAATPSGEDSRGTPTGVAFPTINSESEYGPSPSPAGTFAPSDGSPKSGTPQYSVTIPFFCNKDFEASTTSQFVYCLRIISASNEWTRFHTFEDFVKLKNILSTSYPDVISGIPDFPPRRGFWTTPSDMAGIKVEADGRKRVLEKWINEIISRSDNCMQLYEFIREETHS
jgi:hypothetical protein